MPMGLMSYLLFSGSFLHDLIRISLNSFVSCLPASKTGGNLVRALNE